MEKKKQQVSAWSKSLVEKKNVLFYRNKNYGNSSGIKSYSTAVSCTPLLHAPDDGGVLQGEKKYMAKLFKTRMTINVHREEKEN